MTVRQLINKLRLYPDDATVHVKPHNESYAALVVEGSTAAAGGPVYVVLGVQSEGDS